MGARALTAAILWIGLSCNRSPVRELPAGVMVVHREMAIAPHTELRGAPSGTTLRAAGDFQGRGILAATGPGIRIRNLAIDGNRAALEVRSGLPPYDQPFARFTPHNGVWADRADGLTIDNVRFREVAGFAVLISRSSEVAVTRVTVEDSGSRNPKGRNNTTGGILLEEGAANFRVAECNLRRIRGNGIWTHSLYTSPRNSYGIFERNRLADIGRDALQVGHAHHVEVRDNFGVRIGFPPDDVDAEGGGIPVGIDTAGNVSDSQYLRNRFETMSGKCIDLDGFHDGSVIGNTCVGSGNYAIVMNNTNPDMQSRNIRVEGNEIRGALFGGIFVIGEGHTVVNNRLFDLNSGHRDDPGVLGSGIYLGSGAERPAPARANRVEGNTVTGYKMAARCVAVAPGIEGTANVVRNNDCKNR